MSCCEILTKVFLIFINVIAIILGLILIVIGSLWVSLPASIPGSDSIYPVLTLVLGCVTCVIAFCGCCGSIVKNVTLLVGYIIFTVVIIGGCIYLCVDFYNVNKAVESSITELLTETFENSDSKDQFHVIEYLFHCCGTTGADSYEAIGAEIPITCCKDLVTNIDDISNINLTDTSFDLCSNEDTYGGCIAILIAELESFLSLGTIILIATIVFEALVVVLTVYLIQYIRAHNKKVRQLPRYPGYPSGLGQPVVVEMPRAGQPRRRIPVESPYYYGSD